jgi:hypothetical protein
MTWPTYNREQLIDDVIALLAEKGVRAEIDPDKASRRQEGATLLLSGLNVIPTLAPEVALDLDGHARYNAVVHGD